MHLPTFVVSNNTDTSGGNHSDDPSTLEVYLRVLGVKKPYWDAS
jgi:hypothetical protein